MCYNISEGIIGTDQGPEAHDGEGRGGPREHGAAFKDLTSRTYGRWRVLEWVGTDAHGSLYRCRCQCGEERVIRGAQLTTGRSRSCGKAGCRVRTPKKGAVENLYSPIASEDRPIYRIWCELMEIAEPDNWRCMDNTGRQFNIACGMLPNVKEWETFRKWTRGEFVIPEFKVMKQNYVEGKVLASKADPIHRPINMAYPDGPQGVAIIYPNLEWVWPDVAREEGRELIVSVPREKYYLKEGIGPVMTRYDLAEAYGVSYSTLTGRLNRGWTIREACRGRKDRA